MNKTELVLTNKTEGQATRTIDSREVVEMVDISHDDLLKKIRKYVTTISKTDLAILPSQNFFVESKYKNARGKEYPCYELTRKGCDMVANKMTGEKGILFTAAYVTKFEEMERDLAITKFNLPTNYKEALLALVAAAEEKQSLIAENMVKEAKLLEQAPKVDLYEDFMSKDNLHSINDIAKVLAIKSLGRNNLYKYLRWNKILYRIFLIYEEFKLHNI